MGKRRSSEQIVRKLRQAEARLATGATVPEVARELGISEATFHRWRNPYGAMSTTEAKRLKELESENARLKKLLAEKELDIDILKEVSRETSEPDSEEGCRRARSAATGDLRASGVRVIVQSRSSQRYEGRKADRERDLLKRMIELSRKNPRYGYRRVWAMLRREGWPVNKKRVHRLWRKEGLKIPEGKQHKRGRIPILGASENNYTRRRATHRNHLWSYDFVMDLTEDGRRLKIMPVVDEYTK